MTNKYITNTHTYEDHDRGVDFDRSRDRFLNPTAFANSCIGLLPTQVY